MNANPSIKCSVASCSYHAGAQNSCTLNEIKVGCTKSDVANSEATECASFQLGNHGASCTQ
ncbi:conserved hypothetical protein [uncultured Eubacteriales bacterium]|uniref:DUF1540 domain-containing protein n=1 Tax=uncultured Eubacteriales bacterium TaxID=172733 RepID=A0A212J366_9FIRM|nr:conserved hypothetical protein [uncultured Eubacteriales bacterium]